MQNLAPVTREEWCSAVVPFAAGSVPDAPDLHVEGHATVWQPFGARWPDGSVRQALCFFRTELARSQEKILPLADGAGPELGDGSIQLPAVELELQARIGETWSRALLESAEVLESNEARVVRLLRCRVGDSGLVGEVILTAYRDQDHGYADLAVFFSDPETEDMQRSIAELAIEARGMVLVFRHGGPLGVAQQPTARGSRTVLLQNAVLGDGQGIRRTGAIVPTTTRHIAAVYSPPLAATSWRGTGAFGAFGYVPEPPPWLSANRIRQAMFQRQRLFQAASRRAPDPLMNGPWGLARNAGQTGDQQDFGVVKLEGVAGSGIPSFLLEVELSVLQEACRPVHFFESDGRPVEPAAHPDWVVWSGRTHWHAGVSKDRLGKPSPEPRFQTHGWSGKDRQHWSTNYLATWYLMTGQHWALRELQNEVRLYMAGQTVRPGLSTSGPGAPRGAGRVMLAASWLYLCTGDAALLERMNERIDRVYFPNWHGRDQPPEKVRTMAVAGRDARMLGGETEYWTPWQDALAAVGFAAAHRISGNERALQLARGLSLNTLRHGWKVTDRLKIIATAIRSYPDGSPPPAAALAADDPSVVLWSHGTAFSDWAIGAVQLARGFAADDEDREMVQRADQVLTWLRQRRTRPQDGWFDRLGEWDAIR